MNELQVLVRQTPGVITWNFEDLKAAISEEMKIYETVVYDDGAIKMAKSDVAMLRKLRKQVEDRRKEIKNACLQPYEIIEAQAKELVGLIDKPIELIDGQVKSYEEEQKEKRKAKVMDYMTEKFASLPENVVRKLMLKTFNPKWANATAKVEEWKRTIDNAEEGTRRELGILKGVDKEFLEAVMNEYTVNLDITQAMAKVQELQKQKEMILENERRRREAEEERKLREQLAREAAACEGERKKVEAEQQAAEAKNEISYPVEQQIGVPEPVKEEPLQRAHGEKRLTVTFIGTETDIRGVLGYAKYKGVRWEAI